MRNDQIEAREVADTELDAVSGGVLNDAMGQLGSTVEGVLGADVLGGENANLGGNSASVGGVGIAPVTGLSF
jgi:hypothetical protein